MDIETDEDRYIENCLRQDETVSDDHHQLRRVAAQLLESLGRAQRRRLLDRETELERMRLDRAGSDDASSPCRPIGLRVHRAHPMSRGVQGRERRHCEFRRAGKDDVQRGKMARSQFTSSVAKRLLAIVRKIGSGTFVR